MEFTFSTQSMTGSRSMSVSSLSGSPMSTGWWPRQRISRYSRFKKNKLKSQNILFTHRATQSLSPCLPTSRQSTCCLEQISLRSRRWWPGSTRGGPHQVKETFVEKTNFIFSFSGVKPKNGEEMAISRVGKDLYKMLIKVLKNIFI